jgi:signal transduction histidine kinase
MARGTASLRSRLLVSGLLGMLVAAVAVAAMLGAAFERSVMGALDRRLTDDMYTIAGQVAADGDGRARLRQEPPDARYARVFSGHYWVVQQADREFRSRSLWDAGFPANAWPADAAPTRRQFVDFAGPLGQSLRAATQVLDVPGVDGPVRIIVASDIDETLAEIASFRLKAGIAGACVAAALLLLLAAQASYVLRPLGQITEALRSLQNGESRRLEVERFPREIRPLAAELDAVLGHHRRMVERARAGAADLAHALKTPLSVMLAAAGRPDATLGTVVGEQVARMQRDIDRHLAVATPADHRSRTAVGEVVDALIRLLSGIHAERGLEFEIDVPDGDVFRGNRPDLEDMLGNLMDNACKWAQARVLVQANMEGEQLAIAVSDDGPGIAEADLGEVGKRGVRLDEQTPGSGHGLSIVSALAESYGGELVLERASPSGLRAELLLPGSVTAR